MSSDLRAVGDGPVRMEVNSDFPSAEEPGDSISRTAPQSETDNQVATELLVPAASFSPTDGIGSIDEIIELSSTGSEMSSPLPGHILR